MCPYSENLRMRPTTDEFEVVPRFQQRRASRFDTELSWEDYASKYLEFTDTAPTIFHAVDYVARELEAAGFSYLSERDSWTNDLKESQGGRFYTIRNGTSILAFVKGKHWRPSHGAGIAGSHIDSLTVIVKPTSIKSPIDGYELIGVAPYASGLGETWWDRDLGIGGRLVVRKDRGVRTQLVRIPHPVARIASLAQHFGTPSQGPFNPETQKVPFVGLVNGSEQPEPTEDEKKSPLFGKHSLRLLRALSRESGVPVRDIIELELHLFDTQPATLAGLDKEFLFAPRIDDKACTYVAALGLIEAADELEQGDSLNFFAAYNFEEVGSLSREGAYGNLLEAAVDRILSAEGGDTERAVFYANSFFVSADVTHAVNPNFDNIYLEHHKPKLNVGVTISRDPNGHMISDSVSVAFVEEISRRTKNTVQQFQIRNDSRSGGTIGPTLSSKIGVRGIDLGIAQLSMHSIRAAIGSKDIWLGVRWFKSFFKVWREVDQEFQISSL